MKPLRTAVIGVGHLGRIHARLLAKVEGVELTAVVDLDESNRLAAAGETGAQPCADYHEILGRIDAAVVATPTVWHHAVAVDLLNSGVHLLVEKPLASSTAQAEELVELARRQGLVLQVGHIERFNPALAAAAPFVQEPKYIEATRTSGYSFRSTDIGAVMDLMVHDLDVALWLIKSPLRRVDALGVALFGPHEDAANARLEFENGCVAAFNASRASHSSTRRMDIWSRRAFTTIDFAARTTEVVRPSEAITHRQLDAARLEPAEQQRLKATFLETYLPRETLTSPSVNPLEMELCEFVASIRTGAAVRVPGEQGRDVVAAAEQILAAMGDHAWDGTDHGPRGPLGLPRPSVVPGPHWRLKPTAHPHEQREAG